MKFTEEKLEQAFTELLGQEGFPHHLGITITRKPEEVLIEEDLQKFLLTQYTSQGITVTEIKSIILQLKSLSASDLYESNKTFLKMLSDGFILKREDRNSKDIYIQLIDYNGLNKHKQPEADQLIMALRAIALIGLVAIPLHYVVLKRLLAMVETVRAGDPFVAANASRLQTIAWALLAVQLLSIVIGTIANAVSTPAHPLHLQAGFSINGWLAVLLTFLLARVFAHGTLLRDDLEGTV